MKWTILMLLMLDLLLAGALMACAPSGVTRPQPEPTVMGGGG